MRTLLLKFNWATFAYAGPDEGLMPSLPSRFCFESTVPMHVQGLFRMLTISI